MRLEELDKLKISNDLIGNRTRDLPACSMVPQSTLPRALCSVVNNNINLFSFGAHYFRLNVSCSSEYTQPVIQLLSCALQRVSFVTAVFSSVIQTNSLFFI
jgi:hypothetical protein